MRAILVALFSLVLMGFCFSVDITTCTEITAPGTYDLTSNVSGAPYAADEITPGGTTCMKIAAANVVLDCHGYAISHDLSADSYGIVINSSADDVIVRNCVIHDYDVATYTQMAGDTQFLDNVLYDSNAALMFELTGDNTVVGNKITNISEFLYFTNTGDNTVENNRFYASDGSFLYFTSTGDNTVNSNRFYNDTLGDFLYFTNTGDNTVSDNSIERCNGSSLRFTATGDNTAQDNEFLYATYCEPFEFFDTGDNTLSGNELYDVYGNTFFFEMTGHNSVEDNSVYGGDSESPLGDAFMFINTGNNIVRDNEIHNITADAFIFDDNGDNTLENNLLLGRGPIYPALDIFIFMDTGDNTLNDNSIYNVVDSAFIFTETGDNTLEDNLAAGSNPVFSIGDAAFVFESTGDNTLSGNSAHNISGVAFFLDGTDNNLLENNLAAGGNAMYPMQNAFVLDNTGDNTLSGNSAHNISGMAFTFGDTNDNLLENNLAAGSAPMDLLDMAFIFDGTDDNNLSGNSAYNVSGTAFRFEGTRDNNLQDTYALTSDPWSLDDAFLFFGTYDNNLENSHAEDVSGSAFIFEETRNTSLMDSTMRGKRDPEELPPLPLEASGYGGMHAEQAFYFVATYNNTLTNSEAYNVNDAFVFQFTYHNNLVNSYAYEIGDDAFIFTNTGNNSLADSTVIDPEQAFMFENTGSNDLSNSYLFNATESAFVFEGIGGDVSLSNTEYEGILNYFTMPAVLLFEDIEGNVSLSDTSSSFTSEAFIFDGIWGDVTLDNSYHKVSGYAAFIFDGVDGNVTVSDATYEGLPVLSTTVFEFEEIDGKISVADAYVSYAGDTFEFEEMGEVELTNAEVYTATFAFIFEDVDNVTITDSTSGRCGLGMYINDSNVALNNHHFYESGYLYTGMIYVEGNGSTFDMDNAIFDRRSADKNVQTTLSIDDVVTGAYTISYSYQPDTLPANHGSFAGKFVSILNMSPTSIDEITWHWDQSEVNDGGYTEPEFELWRYNGSTWGGSPINGTPDTVNNEFTQYGLVPGGIYAILEDNVLGFACPVIDSPGTYTMSGDYLADPNPMGVVSACVVIDSSDVTFDCRGHRIIGLRESDSSIGVGLGNGVSNVVVKNCVISGYADGIYGNEVTNAEFTGNDISDTFYGGIKFNGITGELVISDNVIHNSLLGDEAFGGVYFDNDFDYAPEEIPTGATLTAEGNTFHHLYCDDVDECGIGGIFSDDMYDYVTMADNMFYYLEAPEVELATAAYGYRSRVTDNTAHHIYSISDGTTYNVGFAALAASLSEDTPELDPEVTLTNNEIYEYYSISDNSVLLAPLGATFIGMGGFDGVQTTVADNSVHDIYAMSMDNTLLIGTIVGGASAQMIESPVTITGNSFYNVYSFSNIGNANTTAFMLMHLNSDDLDVTATDNEVHHIHTYAPDGWDTGISVFRMIPIFHSSYNLNFSNNSIHHLFSTGIVSGFQLIPFSAENINYWEGPSSLSTPPHEFGALTSEEKEFISAVTKASDSGGYGYANDMEFMATIRDNSLHDFSGGYGVVGFMMMGMSGGEASLRANQSSETGVTFTGNSIYQLLSSPARDGTVGGLMLFWLWPDVGIIEEEPEAALGIAATSEVTATITDNTIHHLSSSEQVFGIMTQGVLCSAYGYGDDQCAVTNAIEDNTLHHLMSYDSDATAITQQGTICISKECDSVVALNGNTIHHISAEEDSQAISSYATVSMPGYLFGEPEGTIQCSATSTAEDNIVHDIYSPASTIGILNDEILCMAFTGSEDDVGCSVDMSTTGNTVHHVAGGYESLGATALRTVCIAMDIDPSSDECMSALSLSENNIHDIYSFDGDVVGAAAGASMLWGNGEATVADNQISHIHGPEPIGLYIMGSSAVAGGAEEEEFKLDGSLGLTATDNTVQSLSGSVPIGFILTSLTCMGQGADCDVQSTVADNTVHGGFGEDASLGFVIGGVECMGYGYASDSCGLESTVADNTGSDLVADMYSAGMMVVGINCYGYGPSCDYENTIAENTMNDISATAMSAGLVGTSMTCVEDGEEETSCTAPLIKENLVHGIQTRADVLGIMVSYMDKAEIQRNTAHNIYGDALGDEPNGNTCMGILGISSATLSGNQLHSCTNGLALTDVNANVTPYRGYNHIYNTKIVDLYLSRGSTSVINISKLVFDSDSDGFNKFTMLSFYDVSDLSLAMDHAVKPRSLPEGFTSFEGKFINILPVGEVPTALSTGSDHYWNTSKITDLMTPPTFLREFSGPNISGLIPDWPEAPEAKELAAVQPLSTEYGREGLTWHWFETESDGYNENALQLWVCEDGAPVCDWVLLNDTPNTGDNMLSLWELDEGSIFAILHNGSKTPTGDDEDEGLLSMDAGFSTSCEENVVTVTRGEGEPLYGATVHVFNADTLATVASGSTDSNGEFDFAGCGFAVSIKITKAGYDSESMVRSLVSCEECEEECVVDSDCPQDYVCDDDQCVREEVPECTNDEGCPEGYECRNGECVPKEPECYLDSDCADDEYCDHGACTPVTGQCGYVQDHEWVQYTCGHEAGCPDCPEGLICEKHECVATGLDCPGSVFVGTQESCNAALNGTPCANCDYMVTDPTGKAYTGRTDENGNIQLPFDIEGLYRVALVKDGEPISQVQVEVVPKAPPSEEEAPAEEVLEDSNWLWLLVLLAMLVLALIYWRRKAGEKVLRTRKKK